MKRTEARRCTSTTRAAVAPAGRQRSNAGRAARAGVVASILLACAICAGCGGGYDDAIDAWVADILPVKDTWVATDVIIPWDDDTIQLLETGWQPTHQPDARTDALWVYGREGGFRFYAARTDGLTLELEARQHPYPDDRRQLVSVSVNGTKIGEGEILPEWQPIELPIPPEAVRVGQNRVDLTFSHATPPRELDPNLNDQRELAARFRWVRIRHGNQEPLEWDKPLRITHEPAADGLRSDERITMPGDSVLEMAIVPSDETRFLARLDARVGSGYASAGVDLIDSSGTEHTLFERTFFAAPWRWQRIDIDLGAWSGQPVAIRLRSRGEANDAIEWHGAGFTALVDSFSSTSVDRPSTLSTAPSGGLFADTDIVVILLDALRADGVFGPDSPPTPNIDAIAAGGTSFTQTWSPSSWTGQTIPSLFTGYYPDAIAAEVWGSPLPDDVMTVTEHLANAGYFTSLWSQHNIYAGNDTLKRGFEAFDEVKPERVENRLLLPGAEDLFVDDRPTFAFVHLLPPHTPYTPPEPFRGSLPKPIEPDFEFSVAAMQRLSLGDEANVTPELVAYARARYDENVMFGDHLVGRLVETMRAAGRYDDAMIIVLADHGDAFFEHGEFGHTRYVYEEYVHVPLIIKWPTGTGNFAPMVDEPVTLVDFAATVADAVGIGGEHFRTQGRSLLPLVFASGMGAQDEAGSQRGADPSASLASYPVGNRYLYTYTRTATSPGSRPSGKYALRRGRYKLVYFFGATYELFDLELDPTEQNDIAGEEPTRAKLLLEAVLLTQHQNGLHAEVLAEGLEPAVLDEETLRQLRALGYIQ